MYMHLHTWVRGLLRLYSYLDEFEKWRAIRASVGGVGGVLAWVTC